MQLLEGQIINSITKRAMLAQQTAQNTLEAR